MRILKLLSEGLLALALMLAAFIAIMLAVHYILTGAEHAVTWLMSFF
jgi:hypothetical protein